MIDKSALTPINYTLKLAQLVGFFNIVFRSEGAFIGEWSEGEPLTLYAIPRYHESHDEVHAVVMRLCPTSQAEYALALRDELNLWGDRGGDIKLNAWGLYAIASANCLVKIKALIKALEKTGEGLQ